MFLELYSLLDHRVGAKLIVKKINKCIKHFFHKRIVFFKLNPNFYFDKGISRSVSQSPCVERQSVVTMEPLALKTQTEKGETLDAGIKMWIPGLTLSFTVD